MVSRTTDLAPKMLRLWCDGFHLILCMVRWPARAGVRNPERGFGPVTGGTRSVAVV